MKRLFVTAARGLILLVAGTAVAHHSPILFDRTKKVTVTGIVREFAWTNPHASVQLDVTAPSGGAEVAFRIGDWDELLQGLDVEGVVRQGASGKALFVEGHQPLEDIEVLFRVVRLRQQRTENDE